MPSILPGYEYDIFISYRQKDNKGERWVTEFVNALKTELEATFKEDISIYFDENPHDGLLESHQVDESLSRKLNSLIFVPIISQTYCDANSFAWQQELISFIDRGKQDAYGLNVQLSNGNVASRVLPIRIHELNTPDTQMLEKALQGKLRCVDFIYHSAGVNRPLRSKDDELHDNEFKTIYRNQINKVANAIKGLIEGLRAVEVNENQTGRSVTQKNTANEIKIAEEIKKRDLVKVALAYIIVALVIWKVVELSSNLLSLSTSIAGITAIILTALFPVAMFLAWKFEKAPTGFIRSDSPAAKNNPFSSYQKKPLTSNTTILGLLVMMLLLYFVPQQLMPGIRAASVNRSIENKSIAVLYFDNLSGDPEQEYMSDGLTEEIIARLTKIEGLRVISRTSVRVYKGKPLNLKKIAEELNVDIVLEGSVRKVDNQLKIVAQLIDAETDEHFWAETYNRELKDVFTVQTEIAEAIADKFEITMSPEINLKVSAISTPNTEAYDYYLRGRHIAFNQFYYRRDSVAFVRSKVMYEKAIQLDPKFALAYAGLADLYDAARGDRFNINFYKPEMDSLRHALSWKAYQLDPNSAFVNNVRIWMLINRDEPLFDSAFYHARKALQLEPEDYYNSESMGDIFTNGKLGLDDLSVPFLEKAVDLNPLSAKTHVQLGSSYLATGQFEKADREFQKAYDLSPSEFYLGAPTVMMWLVRKGRLDEAEKMRNDIMKSNPRFTLRGIQAALLVKRGETSEATKLVKQMKGNLGFLYALLGNEAESIKELKKEEDLYTYYLWLQNDKFWDNYRDNPEFQQILAKHKARYDANKEKYGKYAENISIK